MKIQKIFETPPLPPYLPDADITIKSADLSFATRIANFISVGRISIFYVLDVVERSALRIRKIIKKIQK